MQYVLAALASLAVIPVLVYASTVDSLAYFSLLCVALIVGSLYLMFSPGDTPTTSS